MAALTRLSKSKCSNLFNSMEHCLAARSFASSNRPIRLRKDHKGRMKGIACRGDHISFGSFALQAQDSSWITARQIEAGRRAMQRSAGKTAKIWVRLIADKSVTGKPIGTRMGSGKGAPQYTVAVVKPGRVLYEVGGVPENVAKKAVALAAAKMPIKTVFRTRSFCTGATEGSEELGSYQQIEAVEKSDNCQRELSEPDSPERSLLSLPNLLGTLELGD